jgi:hypothetical protein
MCGGAATNAAQASPDGKLRQSMAASGNVPITPSLLDCLGLLLPLLSCSSDVEVLVDTDADCAIVPGAVSATEAGERARCVFPHTREIDVFSYTTSAVQHVSTATGRYGAWQFLIRREGVFHVVDISEGGDRSAPIDPPGAAQCEQPLHVIDSVHAIEMTLGALREVDPAGEDDEIGIAHVAPCVNREYPPAPLVYVSNAFEGPGYRYVLFDDTGAVMKVCSSNACRAGLEIACCEG